ncbi:MAG TPA: energy transducer TonB [Chthoniobacterales bacterium]
MNPDRPGRWYLAAFLLAAGAHAALFTALPARPAPAAGKAAPVEVELVAARPLETLPPEPPSAPPPEPAEIPPEPEPAPEPPAEPPPAPAATPEMTLPKPAPAPKAPAPPKNSVPSRKAAPPAAPVKPPASGSSGAVREARPDTPRNRPPHYPEIARRNGWEGVVIVRARVTAAGRVSSVSIHRGSSYGVLNQAALAAVKSWRFRPGSLGGQAVESAVEVPVNFSLRR